MKPPSYLAFDLGAESGRAFLGAVDADRLTLAEVHRFANGPVRLPDGIHWDVLRLWSEIKTGLSLAAHQTQANLASVGLDAWGVDFALLDRQGSLLGNPFHYRDSRTTGILTELFQRMPREKIYEYTGIQFMPINTVCQLLSMVIAHSPVLDVAQTILTIPDLFNYWMSGRIACELTNATTTQCFDPRQHQWALEVLRAMEIPTHIFPDVVRPGTRSGRLLPELAEEVGAGPVPVISVAGHDTGSAVAAIPATHEHFAWISSGTWSIIGVESPHPVINPRTLANNMTNEGGVNDTWRLSQNLTGLWLVQECKRTWARQGEDLSYDEINRLASEARPFLAAIDPDHDAFLPPGDMPARIRAFCERTGQRVPDTKGEIVRVALESIALKYRWLLERLETLRGHRLEPIHIIGGGAKNALLNQLTANATQREVISGPVEATAIGNILVQAVSLGHIRSIREGRDLIGRSVALQTFEPGQPSAWEDAYAAFREDILARD